MSATGAHQQSLYQALSDSEIQSIERLLEDDHADELSKLWIGLPRPTKQMSG